MMISANISSIDRPRNLRYDLRDRAAVAEREVRASPVSAPAWPRSSLAARVVDALAGRSRTAPTRQHQHDHEQQPGDRRARSPCG